MATGNIQRIYDEYVSTLPTGERLRLVELITRGLAEPGNVMDAPAEVPIGVIGQSAGWQPTDRRESRSEWRDRAL
jgi:hypothetical protein